MAGIHRDTIMRLGVRVGQGCARLLDVRMRDLDCRHVEVDELWGFIGKKAKNVTPDDGPDAGDVWTFISLDSETKLIPSHRVGKRDFFTARAFVYDLSKRLRNRIQLSADGLTSYVGAVAASFGTDDVDFGQIVKTYDPPAAKPASTRYSPGDVTGVEKYVVFGDPPRDRPGSHLHVLC